MKHLLYKEFYLGRKYYITSLLLFLIVSLMGILIRISMKCGNLANLSAETFNSLDSATFTVFTYLPSVILFISSCTDGGVIFSDYNTKWAIFCYTAPISEKKTVGIKFIAKIIILTAALILGVTNAIIIGMVADKPIDGNVILNILVLFSVTVIFSSVIIVCSMKLKSKNAVGIFIFLIISVISIPIIIKGFNYLDEIYTAYGGLDETAQNELIMQLVTGKYTEIRNILAPLLPVIIVVFPTIAFICSIKIMKRREN